MSKELPKDPTNAGWVLGWGVVKNAPWSLHGVFLSKDEAESQAQSAGEGYVARYGSHKPGTDDFVFSDLAQK
ncbi:hypothetical protein [Pseudomonas fluorescens]